MGETTATVVLALARANGKTRRRRTISYAWNFRTTAKCKSLASQLICSARLRRKKNCKRKGDERSNNTNEGCRKMGNETCTGTLRANHFFERPLKIELVPSSKGDAELCAC